MNNESNQEKFKIVDNHNNSYDYFNFSNKRFKVKGLDNKCSNDDNSLNADNHFYSCFSINKKVYKENDYILGEYEYQSNVNKSRSLLDPIYGTITLPSVCWQFIDKFEFQRLRNLKQLGNSHYIFYGATHTRFEHCIGTANLAYKTINYLNSQLSYMSSEELNYKKESLALAGLLHDIGHGPYSHLFDSILKYLYKENGVIDQQLYDKCDHEVRSALLIDHMVDKYNIDIEKDTCYLVKNLINGGEFNRLENQKEDWLYQIVANNSNSIDVDKFDYLQRDSYMIGLKTSIPNYDRIFKNAKIINGKICYNIKNDNDLFNLFQTRYKQYKQIYYHKTTEAIDLMTKDALLLSNSYYNFLDIINSMKNYMLIDDGIVNNIQYIANNIDTIIEDNDRINIVDIKKASKLVDRIKNRDLYVLAVEKLLSKELINLYNNLKPEDICINKVNKDDIIIHFHSLDYGNKDRNPFDSIEFYREEKQDSSYKIQIWKSSLSVPPVFREKYIRIYCKNACDKDEVIKGFKMYVNNKLGINLDNGLISFKSKSHENKCDFYYEVSDINESNKKDKFLNKKRDKELM